MATIYKRIRHLRTCGFIREVSLPERLEFGVIVYKELTKEPHQYIGKCQSIEPEGEFTVRSYPKSMVAQIDKLIISHFRVKRNRIKKINHG